MIVISSAISSSFSFQTRMLHTRVTLNSIRSNPLNAYVNLRSRIDVNGLMAPFPEFGNTVKFLTKKLNRQSTDRFVSRDVGLSRFRDIVNMELFSTQLKIRCDDKNYPHKIPFHQPFPYIPTINAIRTALIFFDTVVRVNYTPEIQLYHTDRYTYHYNHIYNNDFIYYPTNETLSLTDFIKTRGIPIGFVGVYLKPIFTDGYYNSPLDFALHDFNHVRRMSSYNEILKKSYTSNIEMYQTMTDFIFSKILPSIDLNQTFNEEERHVRKILTVLYFEFCHEYAFTFDQTSVLKAFHHKPGDPSPFEHMVDDDFAIENLEKLRLPNNNLLSGYRVFRNKSKHPLVRYFFDKGPNFLMSAYNKCINGFYDTKFKRSDELPPMKFRTKEVFLKAIKRMLEVFDLSNKFEDAALLELLELEGPLEIYPNNKLVTPKQLTSRVFLPATSRQPAK